MVVRESVNGMLPKSPIVLVADVVPADGEAGHAGAPPVHVLSVGGVVGERVVPHDALHRYVGIVLVHDE